MNFAEDEPRKVPKPVPFSESPLRPTVPEVSLLLPETQCSSVTQTNNSFSGTEFQTYNAWRWKNLNEGEKENLQRQTTTTKNKSCIYPINDKFSSSNIERRKNEILYGNVDEPRRPLSPRPIPVIPKCLGASFSDASFNNEPWRTDENKDDDKFLKQKNSYNINSYDYLKCNRQEIKSSSNEVNDIGDVCQIIVEQNRHMVLLQRQIEQLLKSQDIKEKQIEQLLKTQEVKENKIEQLLTMQNLKEKHIEQLLKAQEKQEKQIEQLLLSQEKKEKQMHEISMQLKKEVVTVGLMTEVAVAEKSTNTDLQCCCKKRDKGVISENRHPTNESSSDFTRVGIGDQSFTLPSLDLPVIQEHVPTPQSSIHVDIPEYNGSSDDESDTSESDNKETHIHYVPDAKPLGYTFYNNVLMQVNDIIQSQDHKENDGKNKPKINALNVEKSNINKYTCLKENSAKMVSPVSYGESNADKLWGVTCTNFEQGPELPHRNLKGINFTKDGQSPSDISLKMNALALKYLKQEQISQYEMQSQQNNRQPDVTIYNVTNLSFGTMRYLERHRIPIGENGHSNEGSYSPHQFLQQKHKATILNSNFHQQGDF